MNSTVSRRTLVRGMGALAVSIPMIGFLNSCATRNAGGGGSASGGSKELVIAVSALNASLDREYEIGAGSFEAMNNVYEPLVEFGRKPFGDSDEAFVPVYDFKEWELRLLAEEPSVSEDGTTWTLKFREGVMSHSGNELRASDYAYAIERHQGLWALGSFYNFIAGLTPREREVATVVDDYTLEVVTETPNPLFRIMLQNTFAMGVLDAEASMSGSTDDDPWSREWVKANGDKAGHGPYTIVEHSPGQQTIFEAFPDYYRGAPAIDKVTHRLVESSSTRVSLITAGEVDIVRDLLPTEYDSIKDHPGIVVENFDESLFLLLFMMMNNKVQPFDNKQVRQAISYAIPYRQIVDDVYRGYASEWKGIISRDYPFFDPDAWIYGEGGDTAKATALLEEAGYGSGFSSTLLYDASSPLYEQVAVLLQSSLKEIGIQLELKKLSSSAFTEELTGMNYELAVWQDLALTPDIGYNTSLYYSAEAAVNVMQYESAEAQSLVEVLITTLDEGEREQAAKEFQRIVVEDAPAAFLAQPHYVVARRKEVVGITAYPSRTIRFDELDIV